MSDFRIGQVAAQSGVAASAIRYYETQGLLPKAVRRAGQRIYDAEVLQRLTVIELAKEAGFTIAEMKQLLKGLSMRSPASQRWKKLAKTKLKEIDQRIERAHRMKQVLEGVSGCDCPTLRDCARFISAGDARLAEGAEMSSEFR